MTLPLPSLPGILLAAGASRRMGRPKLTLELGGRSLFGRSLHLASQAGLNPLLVVLAPDSEADLFREALSFAYLNDFYAETRLIVCLAEKASQGQAESLKAGLRRLLALEPDAPGFMALLADQPLLKPDLLRQLLWAFARENISVAPEYRGQRGNPVILQRDLFAEILRLEGDQGARTLLARHPLHLLPCQDEACLLDADTPDDFCRLRTRLASDGPTKD